MDTQNPIVPLSNAEKAEAAIADVFQGLALRPALDRLGMHVQAFYTTIRRDSRLGELYASAKEARAEILASEVVDIADTDADAQRARNRIQARQWYASKVLHKVYGDRLDVNVSTTVDIGSALEQARSRVLRPDCDQISNTLDEIDGKALVNEPGAIPLSASALDNTVSNASGDVGAASAG